MTKYMIISMRSGEKHTIEIDPNEKSPIELAEEFYKAMDFANSIVMRANNKIILLKHVEAFTFVKGDGPYSNDINRSMTP